jgi:hypothetical protein
MVRLTESGAQPPAELALLLLALPLLFTLQKLVAVAEFGYRKRPYFFTAILLFAFLHPFKSLISISIMSTNGKNFARATGSTSAQNCISCKSCSQLTIAAV